MNVITEIELQDLLKAFAHNHPDIQEGFVFIPSSLSLIPARTIYDLESYNERIREAYKDEVESDALDDAFENGDALDPQKFECGEEGVCDRCPLAKAIEYNASPTPSYIIIAPNGKLYSDLNVGLTTINRKEAQRFSSIDQAEKALFAHGHTGEITPYVCED